MTLTAARTHASRDHLVDPGVVLAHRWYPEVDTPDLDDHVHVGVGVGVKPST